MHAVLSAVLLMTAAQTNRPEPQHVVTVAAEGGCSRARVPCGGRAHCRACVAVRSPLATCCWGHMPQTCCGPWFGCCPGSPCHIHRYSASRGYYYSEAHNYRHLFDYPWHATRYQPPHLFTHHDGQPPSQEQIPTPYPDRQNVLFEPLPMAPSPP
jgi:hypothetical protein